MFLTIDIRGFFLHCVENYFMIFFSIHKLIYFFQESNCKPKSERFPCKQCPQVLRDMKSLQIHQFVEHHHESTIHQNRQFGDLATAITSVGTTTAVNTSPAVVRLPILQNNPTSTIQHHPGIVYRQIRHDIPNAGIPKSVHPPHPPPSSLNLSNGAGAPSSREGSISSDSGEGRAASPILNLKCDLCGLTNITSSKALQKVNINLGSIKNVNILKV